MTMFYAFGVKRRSDATYTHASRNGSTGAVKFHKTYGAAARAAGRWGHVATASLHPADVNEGGHRASRAARQGRMG